MSDRHHDQHHHHHGADVQDEPIEEEVIASGLGGPIIAGGGPIPAVDDRQSSGDQVLDTESDWESGESDDALLQGRSPEFEHLTKPSH